METPVTIRLALPDEIETTRRFFAYVFEEVGISRARWVKDWQRRYVAYLRRRIEAGHGRIHVAVSQNSIVGCSHGIVREGYPAEIFGGGHGYIFGVYVVPEARRQGIGARLVLATIDFLRSAGCDRIRLHAAAAALPLYERLGFEATNEMQITIDPVPPANGE